ncbi:MAG: MarR family winged helix-turn-helix transcriptional regulator [Marmoricola sp.]
MSGSSNHLETARELEREIGVFVRRIRHSIVERARMTHPELSAATYTMLVAISESGPMRGTDLADLFAIDKGAVSRQVQHLRGLGLVDRVPDPTDERGVRLEVTAPARERLAEVDRLRRAEFEQRFADWTTEDLARLIELLARYNAAFD